MHQPVGFLLYSLTIYAALTQPLTDSYETYAQPGTDFETVTVEPFGIFISTSAEVSGSALTFRTLPLVLTLYVPASTGAVFPTVAATS